MLSRPLILASSSAIRLQLLRSAGMDVTAHAARVDEEAVKASLESEGVRPVDIADSLAEMKAAKVSGRHARALVLGCDQVLDLKGTVLSKPATRADARGQLVALRGQTHSLLSAAVLYDAGQPIWRHVAKARLTMRTFSDSYLDDYLARNWPEIGTSVGAYQLESEGVRLFDRIDGDYFTILGLPLLPLLSYLSTRGFIPS